MDWHAERSVQTAIRFSDAVDAALAVIAESPARFASIDAMHRECPLRRFPFRIVYRFDETRVVVVAIAHTKRHRGYWRDRD